MKLLSPLMCILTWLFVGLLASEHMSPGAATLVGFVAFAIVAGLTYPKQNKVE